MKYIVTIFKNISIIGPVLLVLCVFMLSFILNDYKIENEKLKNQIISSYQKGYKDGVCDMIDENEKLLKYNDLFLKVLQNIIDREYKK